VISPICSRAGAHGGDVVQEMFGAQAAFAAPPLEFGRRQQA
jgi:hypothetical protein